METQRGRSPSSGNRAPARHTPSPSPAAPYNNVNNTSSVGGVSFDHDSGLFPNSDYNQQQQQQQPQQQHQHQHLATSSASQPAFDGNIDFASGAQSFFPDQALSQADSSGLVFGTQGSNAFSDFPSFDPTAALNELNDPSFDAPLFSSGDNQFSLNSAAVDPILLGSQDSNHHNPMATQTQSPTPPHLLAPGMNRQASGSPHSSPAMAQGAFQPPPPRHSRNGSLDPSSAAFPQMQQQSADWGAGMAFQGHRRTYSDAHSDISSAHASPYLATHDSFDGQHSPNLAPQDPIIFQEVMGLSHVSLAEGSPSYISPAHSPHISPRLLPSGQHHSPAFPPVDHFNLLPGMTPTMNNQYNGQSNQMFQATTQDSFPQLNQPTANADYPAHGDAMTPPEINIQLAPPSRTSSFEPQNKIAPAEGALSPPERSRGRAKSDPFSSRGTTPSRDALSPHAAGVGSRSPSPSSKSRRSSTSSVPNRDYILDLADPSRPASGASETSGGSSSKRTQKHPATFQCSLCPKRFTRAYNLRSHLRTHTDERPFVCSVCGKAFARQHDRKRHEGLHSGEKKFVCKGQLKDSNSWGCGRRFARADALGRHFRSEAGRVCIKPLMDEEAIERGNTEQAATNAAASGMPGMGSGMIAGQPMMQPQSGFDYQVNQPVQGNFEQGMQMGQQPQMPYRLPQALLQQYPTLGGIWDQLPANGPDEIEDISGRSSFDASSAGEYDDEGDYGQRGGAYGWVSDVGA